MFGSVSYKSPSWHNRKRGFVSPTGIKQLTFHLPSKHVNDYATEEMFSNSQPSGNGERMFYMLMHQFKQVFGSLNVIMLMLLYCENCECRWDSFTLMGSRISNETQNCCNLSNLPQISDLIRVPVSTYLCSNIHGHFRPWWCLSKKKKEKM